MSATVKGTFASGQSSGIGQTSEPLVIQSGTTSIKLSLAGTIDASNTAKTQKSTDNGETWVDQTTYNSAQTLTAVTVVAGEHWRLNLVAQQAIKAMDYTMTQEN